MPDPEPGTVNGSGTLLGKPAAAATTAAVSVGPGPEPMPRPWLEPDDVCNGGNVDDDEDDDVCGGCGGCGVCAAFVEGVVGDEAARRVETAF